MHTGLIITGTYAVLLLPYIIEEPLKRTIQYITRCKCSICERKHGKISYNENT